MSQGNSLWNYLKQKCQVFFFYKIGKQEGRTGPVGVGELVLVEGGRMWGNGVEEWMWCKYCVPMCVDEKMRLNGGRGR
jgi:hypothetical protein